MLICANFKTKELIVFDSMVVLHSNSDLEHELRMICTNFPSLLAVDGVIESNIIALDQWRIRRDATVPQQDEGGDCGIFACKFFEYDITGSNMDTITQDRMSYFRKQYAIQIWANHALF